MDVARNLVIRGIVLSVGKPFDFKPDGSDENIFGCKMFYLPTTDLDTPHVDDETEILGHCPQEVKLDPSFYAKAKEVGLPCVADITLSVQFKTSGAKVSVAGVNFIKKKDK